MLIKTLHLLLLFVHICLGQTNVEMNETTTDNELFNKINILMTSFKEEILQYAVTARDDIVRELKQIRVHIDNMPNNVNLQNLNSKIELLATSASVNQLTEIVTTGTAAIQNRVNTCINNQEAIKSILSENITMLASQDDLANLSSLTINTSMVLTDNILQLRHTVGNISNKLTSMESTVAFSNQSLENTVVQLESIMTVVDESHEHVENIQSIIDANIRNLTLSVDEIGLQVKNLSTQNNIEQLSDIIVNISDTELQVLSNLKVSIFEHFNSTSIKQQLSELPSKEYIAEMATGYENKIVSLNVIIKSISATINVTESSIEEIGDNIKSFNGIFNYSLSILTSVRDYINITHALLSKCKVDINSIILNSDVISNGVMQKLENLSLVVNELKLLTRNMTFKDVVDQVADNMNSIISNEIKPLQAVQNNISKIVNSQVISNAISELLSAVNDLAKENKNNTTMVSHGILSLKSVFDDLMGKLENFTVTVDNVQNGVQIIYGSINTTNSEVAVTNDKFKIIESAINSINGTLSTVLSIVETFDTDLDSCTSNISLVQDKLDLVHLDIDLVEDGIISVHSSIDTVDNKLTIISDLVSPLENKSAMFHDIMEKGNGKIMKINDTITSISRKLDILDNISKTEDLVYNQLQIVENALEDIQENAGFITSFTSEIDDGITIIQDSIHSLNTTVQNIQQTALSINTTTHQIESYTAPCLPPYASLGSQCIIIIEDKKTWMDARDNCSNRGLGFLEIKQDSIHPLTKYLSVKFPERYHIWIGASDIDQEGTFFWTSGNVVDMSWGWGIGQPNDWGEGEDCTELCSIHDEHMNDINCNEEYMFACEKL